MELRDCDAWIILHAAYFNDIAVHVTEDGKPASYDDRLMTLSARIHSEDEHGLWLTTNLPVTTKGEGVSEMSGKFLIPWRHIEGVHALDADMPSFKRGRIGFDTPQQD